MTLDFDPADLGVVDGAENISLERMTPAGTTTISVAGALRGRFQRGAPAAATASLSLEPETTVWHLPSAQLVGFEPRPGDTLTAGAANHVIVAAARITLGTRWRVVTQALRG